MESFSKIGPPSKSTIYLGSCRPLKGDTEVEKLSYGSGVRSPNIQKYVKQCGKARTLTTKILFTRQKVGN